MEKQRTWRFSILRTSSWSWHWTTSSGSMFSRLEKTASRLRGFHLRTSTRGSRSKVSKFIVLRATTSKSLRRERSERIWSRSVSVKLLFCGISTTQRTVKWHLSNESISFSHLILSLRLVCCHTSQCWFRRISMKWGKLPLSCRMREPLLCTVKVTKRTQQALSSLISQWSTYLRWSTLLTRQRRMFTSPRSISSQQWPTSMDKHSLNSLEMTQRILSCLRSSYDVLIWRSSKMKQALSLTISYWEGCTTLYCCRQVSKGTMRMVCLANMTRPPTTNNNKYRCHKSIRKREVSWLALLRQCLHWNFSVKKRNFSTTQKTRANTLSSN